MIAAVCSPPCSAPMALPEESDKRPRWRASEINRFRGDGVDPSSGTRADRGRYNRPAGARREPHAAGLWMARRDSHRRSRARRPGEPDEGRHRFDIWQCEGALDNETSRTQMLWPAEPRRAGFCASRDPRPVSRVPISWWCRAHEGPRWRNNRDAEQGEGIDRGWRRGPIEGGRSWRLRRIPAIGERSDDDVEFRASRSRGGLGLLAGWPHGSRPKDAETVPRGKSQWAGLNRARRAKRFTTTGAAQGNGGETRDGGTRVAVRAAWR